MYPIKARNGSVFEPNKAPSVGLTLGLLDRPFGLLKLRMFGQLDENPGKAEFLESDGRIRTSVVGFGQDGISEEAKVFGTVAHVHPGKHAGKNQKPVKTGSSSNPNATGRSTCSTCGKMHSGVCRAATRACHRCGIRVKNDRLWGESDCLNDRRSDGNRSRSVRRDRIKQNKPTLRQSRFLPSTHLDQIMRLEPYWPARA
ncbi:hypothetical protein F2Q69_00014529 [Brassica cretica]|uniref:Uncharacterized protein n=1 Tax=Brassica cretica TaxID=69181 RepID=A0A8S9R8T1_BRACR|nr:hypothetical protein F2Q69_00014529 [Brassica cretica]